MLYTRLRINAVKLPLLITVLTALLGCGQKGALYLPQDNSKREVASQEPITEESSSENIAAPVSASNEDQ